MRFLQLKRDPNNVVKKRLVKSKKNWIVVTSLTFAGGCILLSTPALTVEASDVATLASIQTKTSSTNQNTIQPNTKTAVSAVASTKVSSETATKKVAPVVKPEAAVTPAVTTKNPVSTPVTTDTISKSEPVQNIPTVTKPVTIKPDTTPIKTVTPKTDSTKSAVTPKVVSTTTDKIQSAETKAISLFPIHKKPAASDELDSDSTSVDPSLPIDQPAADTDNIASGTSSTSHWYISKDKTLHLGAGELAENSGKTTSPWVKNSDNITSASIDGYLVASHNMSHMFSDLPRLTTIKNFQNIDFSKTTDISNMLSNDTSLQSIDFSHSNLISTTTANSMLKNDVKLQSANFENNKSIANIHDYSHMFENDSALTSVAASDLQMSSATDVSSMFKNDTSLGQLNIRGWVMKKGAITGDSSKGTGMFDGTNLAQITLGQGNQFQSTTALPSNRSNTWQSIGNGTEDNPNGNFSFSTNPSDIDLGHFDIKDNISLNGMTFAPKVGSVTNTLTIHSKKNGSDQPLTVKNLTGDTGDSIIVDAPFIPGYHPDKNTVTAHVNTDGTITTDDNLIYSGDHISNAVVTIHSTVGDIKADQTASDIQGNIGETTSVDAPTVKGYTPSQKKVSVTINDDGTVSTTDHLAYTGNEVSKTVDLPSNLGIQKSQLVTGRVGQSILIQVPDVTGYTHTQDTISATINTDEQILPNEDITYNGIPVTGKSVTVQTSNGPKIIKDIHGSVGDTVSVDAPVITGYTPKDEKVSVIINPDQTVSLVSDKTLIYTGNPVTNKTLTITTNKGPQMVPGINSTIGANPIIKVPHITGYTSDKQTVTAHVDENGLITTQEQIIYTGDPVTTPINITTVVNSKKESHSIQITGKVGDSQNIDAPTITGYTPKDQIHISIKPDKTISIQNPQIDYTPNPVKNVDLTVTIGSEKVVIPNLTGTVGQSVKVPIKSKPGFNQDKDYVTATFNPNGTVTTTDKVTFTPKTFTHQKVVIHSTNEPDQTVADVTGTFGKKATIKVPNNIPGYHSNTPTVQATVGPDGSITPDENITYIGNDVSGKNVIVKTNRGDKKVTNIGGQVGKTVTVNVPNDVQGYHPDKTTITATVNADETITSSEKVTYLPDQIKNQTVTLTTNKGAKQVANISGTVDSETNVAVPNNIQGYHPDKKVISAKVNPDGSITANEKVTYLPDNISNQTVTIKTNKGDKKVTNVDGLVDQHVTIHVPNDVPGYHPNKTEISATVNPNGTITPDESISYLGNTITTKVKVHSNLKDQLSETVTGQVGKTVKVKVPDVQGYTHDLTEITANVNPDGSITSKTQITYTGRHLDNKTLTVTSNHGKVIIPNLSGQVGKTIIVNVPAVPGYSNDKQTITAIFNPDGTVTTQEKIVYKQNPKTPLPVPVKIQKQTQHINTYFDQPQVPLYFEKTDQTMAPLANQNIDPGSALISQESLTIGDITYYQIGDNVWIKANQVYPYQVAKDNIVTRSGTAKRLYTAEGILITNHTLAANTYWLADRIIYINGIKFYRIAINEFVQANDVYTF